MKKSCLLFAIVLGVAAVALAAADMSGTWVLDPAKSDPMMGGRGGARGGGGGAPAGSMEIVVKQTAADLTVTRSFGGNSMETKYVTDGADHTATSQRGDLKYKAAWGSDGLTVTGTRTTQRGDMPMKEVYSISADGKVLTIASTRRGPDGDQVNKQVYNKK